MFICVRNSDLHNSTRMKTALRINLENGHVSVRKLRLLQSLLSDDFARIGTA